MTIQLLAPRVFSFASILEDKAREQLLQVGEMPFIFPHAVGEADMHFGLGCPVGLVAPTLGAIVPSWVGVDIGCGMIAAQLSITMDDIAECDVPLWVLRENFEMVIPMSMGVYNTSIFDSFTEARIRSLEDKDGADQAEMITGDGEGNWRKQFGTMGGGNHFLELCKDREGRLWLFLHSGSRGVGRRLAEKHIRRAKEMCRKYWITLPNEDNAYFVEGTDDFWNYMRDLRWAQHFAMLNREEMLHRARLAVCEWFDSEVTFGEMIRCHHNYTEQMPADLLKEFRGEVPKGHGNVWLTRKGAIDASAGKLGLLPSSMSGASYITRGLGNRMGLWSAPHGAGRLYGRKHAERTFSVDDLRSTMKGIVWSEQIAEKLVDEGRYAYKPIEAVLHDSRSLIEVVNELRQVVNVKGE